jgi:phosphoribosyl 1,2-cyclic phosphodiesterase
MSSKSPLQLLFLGTGTSTGLPLTPCLTLSQPYPEQFTSHVPLPAPSTEKAGWNPDGPWPNNIPCACCRSAANPDVPEGWKNKRGNTGVVARKKGTDGKWRNLVVDVGKTFTEQARRFFPRWGVQTIDAVLLTHGRESPNRRQGTSS